MLGCARFGGWLTCDGQAACPGCDPPTPPLTQWPLGLNPGPWPSEGACEGYWKIDGWIKGWREGFDLKTGKTRHVRNILNSNHFKILLNYLLGHEGSLLWALAGSRNALNQSWISHYSEGEEEEGGMHKQASTPVKKPNRRRRRETHMGSDAV